MNRSWIKYTPHQKYSAMSFWVHIPTDGKAYLRAAEFHPPWPKPVPGQGYPFYYVEIDGFTFEFATLDEMRVLIETFSKPLLPSNLQLTLKRGAKYGPSNHWLNRLPKQVTSWRYRKKAIRYLQLVLRNFEKETG